MEFNATFIVTIISFLLFMYIMNLIFYIPIKTIGEKRNEIISQNNREADNMENNAQAITEETENRYSQAISNANKKMNKKISEANFDSQKQLNELKDKSLREIIEIKRQLKIEEDDAQKVLDSDMESIVNQLTDKILKGGNVG